MAIKVKAPAIYPIVQETNFSNLRTFNFYVVQNKGALFLIDAGYHNDQCWNGLHDTLEKNGFQLSDLDAILVTHHHYDHLGLVNRILDEHPVPIYLHEKAIIRIRRDRDYLSERIRFFNKLYLQSGCGVERVTREINRLRMYMDENETHILHDDLVTIKEGDNVFGFEVLEVPGHSLDHVAFYHEGTRQIIVGDHMIKHISSNAIIDVDRNGRKPLSLVMYENSLRRLLDIQIDTAYSGHGELITNPHGLLHKKLKRIESKGNLILQMLNKPRTPAWVAQKIYKDRYDTLFGLVMSEIIGHIDRLEYYGKVEKKVDNGIFYYERKPLHKNRL